MNQELSHALGLAKRHLRVKLVALHNRTSRRRLLGEFQSIVSVTSFDSRVAQCALAVESIAMGTLKPGTAVLWLDHGFKAHKLPPAIQRLVMRGLTVEYVSDIKSHKKYFFALRQCIESNLPLVTIDDDFLYPPWFLERMAERLKSTPETILCYRAREMMFDAPGKLAPYAQWPIATAETPSSRLFFTSGGGALLPVSLLTALETQGDRFLSCCPDADDIWLNHVASKAGIPKRLVLDMPTDFTPLEVAPEKTLWSRNSDGGNDRQLLATYDSEVLHQIFEADPCPQS